MSNKISLVSQIDKKLERMNEGLASISFVLSFWLLTGLSVVAEASFVESSKGRDNQKTSAEDYVDLNSDRESDRILGMSIRATEKSDVGTVNSMSGGLSMLESSRHFKGGGAVVNPISDRVPMLKIMADSTVPNFEIDTS